MKNKNLLCMIFTLSMLIISLSGCQTPEKTNITCADVIRAYEEADYKVLHSESPTGTYNEKCSVQIIGKENYDNVYFSFFETEEEAQAYAKEHQWNVVLWLYSVACWQPTWVTTKTYQNIEYEYCDSAMIKVFEEMIR